MSELDPIVEAVRLHIEMWDQVSEIANTMEYAIDSWPTNGPPEGSLDVTDEVKAELIAAGYDYIARGIVNLHLVQADEGGFMTAVQAERWFTPENLDDDEQKALANALHVVGNRHGFLPKPGDEANLVGLQKLERPRRHQHGQEMEIARFLGELESFDVPPPDYTQTMRAIFEQILLGIGMPQKDVTELLDAVIAERERRLREGSDE